MRGKVPKIEDGIDFIGITPAYAGKRNAVQFWKSFLWDHPRLCGEKYGYYTIEVSFLGSPPPMRGKGPLCFCSGVVQWDHPRLCGEKFRIHSFITCQPGSPPPMRGKALPCSDLHFPAGITPAYAGKSYRGGVQLQKIWDHPRLCGEKVWFTVRLLS